MNLKDSHTYTSKTMKLLLIYRNALYCPISGQLLQPSTQWPRPVIYAAPLALVMCLVSCWLFPPLILNIIKEVYIECQHCLLEMSNQECICSRLISLEKVNCWRHHKTPPKSNSSSYNNQRFFQKIKNKLTEYLKINLKGRKARFVCI